MLFVSDKVLELGEGRDIILAMAGNPQWRTHGFPDHKLVASL